MARGKWIDKKTAQHFTLVHRPQNDPLIHDDNAPSMVLNPTDSSKIKHLDDLASELGADAASIRANEGEAASYGVFFDDSEYDYMQHLRDLNTGGAEAVFVEANSAASKGKGKQKVSLEEALRSLDLGQKSTSVLDEEMLPSKNLTRVTYEAQQDVPDSIRGFQPDMDPRLREVLEALDDDAFVDDDDDIFQTLAKDGRELDDFEFNDEIDEDGWESEDTAKPLKEYNDPVPDLVTTCDGQPDQGPSQDWLRDFNKFKTEQNGGGMGTTASHSEMQSAWTTTTNGGRRKKRKGALTDASSYSMTSSSLVRTEQMSLLDARFEKLEERYNEDLDDAGSVSVVSTASSTTGPVRGDFDDILGEFLGNYSKPGKPQQTQNPFHRDRDDTALDGPRSIAKKSFPSAIMAGDDSQEGLAQRIHESLREHGIKPPPWPSAPGATENNHEMSKFRDLYEAYRQKVRAALTREGLIDDPDKRKRLSDAIEFKGICEEMCPEHEVITRISEHDVNKPEKDPRTGAVLVERMVKKLARSAAGQEAPLPMDVRSAFSLRRTLDYLVDIVLRHDDNLSSVHPFLWDRTRAIRRDFAFFSSMSEKEVKTQVYVLENITRFHVTSLHLLSRGTKKDETFVEQQELEQLGKTLLSLRDVYDDCNEQGVVCENEAEFRAYYVLFHGRDSGILETLQRQWRPSLWQDSDEIRTAVSLVEALQNTHEFIGSRKDGHAGPLLASSGANVAYFGIVEDDEVSYTMACFAECHFQHLRRSLLATVKRSLTRPKGPAEDVTAASLNEFLRFDEVEQAIDFARLHNLDFEPDQNYPTDVTRQLLVLNDRAPLPHVRLEHQFSQTLVENKRGLAPLPSVIHTTIYTGGKDRQATSNGVDEESLFVGSAETDGWVRTGRKSLEWSYNGEVDKTSGAGPSKNHDIFSNGFIMESGTQHDDVAIDEAPRGLGSLLGIENILANMSCSDTEEDGRDAASSRQKRLPRSPFVLDPDSDGSDDNGPSVKKYPSLEEIRSKETDHFLHDVPPKSMFTPAAASAPPKPNPFAPPPQPPPQSEGGLGAPKPNPFAPKLNPFAPIPSSAADASAPTTVNNPFAAPVQPSTGFTILGSAASNAPPQTRHNPFAPTPQIAERQDANSSGTKPNPFASLSKPNVDTVAAANPSVLPRSSKPGELAAPAASSRASSQVFGFGAGTSRQTLSQRNASPFMTQANHQQNASFSMTPSNPQQDASLFVAPANPQQNASLSMTPPNQRQNASTSTTLSNQRQNALFSTTQANQQQDASLSMAPMGQQQNASPFMAQPNPQQDASLSMAPTGQQQNASPFMAQPNPQQDASLSMAPMGQQQNVSPFMAQWNQQQNAPLFTTPAPAPVNHQNEATYSTMERPVASLAPSNTLPEVASFQQTSSAAINEPERPGVTGFASSERLEPANGAEVQAQLQSSTQAQPRPEELSMEPVPTPSAAENINQAPTANSPAEERPTKQEFLPGFTNWYVNGDNGLLSDFLLHTIKSATENAYEIFQREEKERKAREEKELLEARAQQFRMQTTARKYLKRWREVLRERSLAKVARAGRDAMREHILERMKAKRDAKIAARREKELREKELREEEMARELKGLLDSRRKARALLASGVLNGVGNEMEAATRIVADDSVASEASDTRKPTKPSKSKEVTQRQSKDTNKASPKIDKAPREHPTTNFRRSLPSMSSSKKESMSKVPMTKEPRPRIVHTPPRWKLKSSVRLPDGTVLPAFKRPDMFTRLSERPSAREMQRRRDSVMETLNAVLDEAAQAREKSQAEYKSAVALLKRKRGGEDDVHEDDDDGSKRRAAAGQEGSSVKQVSSPTNNKRQRNSWSGAVDDGDDDDDNDDSGGREAVKRSISTAERMCADIRAMRAELEEGAAWFRTESEKLEAELERQGRGRSG
ncbi:hypothetical protein CP533_2627 [Ophiocordyceps camponoti-saundersi (nom. inval.)]|nr:hypothetical protein CP533_2627 [Ophiocordyceps camponoti-saundersi (nom. inval.)]